MNESLPFIIAPMSYEPETVLLQLEDFKQDIIDAAATYKSAVPNPNKSLLLAINVLLNILTRHIQDHHTHSSMALNLIPDFKL